MAAYLPCRVPYIASPFLQVIVVYRLKPSCKLVRSFSCCGRSSEAVGYVRLDKLRKVLVKKGKEYVKVKIEHMYAD